jgi:hypothetical protein
VTVNLAKRQLIATVAHEKGELAFLLVNLSTFAGIIH